VKHRKFFISHQPAKGSFFGVMAKRITLLLLAGLLLWGGVAAVIPSKPVVAASYYDEQIAKLKDEIDGYNQRAQELSAQADSLSNAIALLQNQQDALQAEINLNKAKIDDLNSQIAANEAKLKEQGQVLGDTLVDMYLNKQTTPLEILASSKNLSDYVDKEAQQATVKEQVNASMQRINQLKQKLQEDKVAVERLVADQESRQGQLTATRQQQQNLLTETQGQEDTYKQLTDKNNQEIKRLQTRVEDKRRRYPLVMKRTESATQQSCLARSHLAGENDKPLPRRDAVLQARKNLANMGHHIKKSWVRTRTKRIAL